MFVLLGLFSIRLWLKYNCSINDETRKYQGVFQNALASSVAAYPNTEAM